MWEYLIPAFATVLVAIIEFFATKDRKQAAHDREKFAAEQAKMEERSRVRARESLLSMKMNDACLQLCVVTSNALTGGHNNGNVERARLAAEEAQKEYMQFIEEIAAGKISE